MLNKSSSTSPSLFDDAFQELKSKSSAKNLFKEKYVITIGFYENLNQQKSSLNPSSKLLFYFYPPKTSSSNSCNSLHECINSIPSPHT
ncbi:hypothetical protein [Nitrosomonas sp. Nm34]|uniref:hypothetical protein n=1 Tax=Nitrosomonas sp. Nm34 TaxID=1881055 RepID=UPI0008E4094A|nr:hypothetical protein [Nitrosomonas sp. Nm34]SFI39944.1 hypothetical protein SAMN05428978_100874 [Nitrosomonas sp. Nm34]